MKKQLNRWKDDINRYWDKTSLMTRVVFGALLSFAVAILLLKGVVNPQRKKLKALTREAGKITAVSEDEIKNTEFRLEQLRKSQKNWNKRLNIAENSGVPYGEDSHLTVVNVIDSLLGDYRILLKTRQDIDEEEEKDSRGKKKKLAGKNAKQGKKQLCGYFRHTYETYARFQNIFLFLQKYTEASILVPGGEYFYQ